MPLIDTEDGATRLAKAIASDLALYQGGAIEAGEDVSDSVEEGRGLFQSRVPPLYWSIYERTIAETKFAAHAIDEAGLMARAPVVTRRRGGVDAGDAKPLIGGAVDSSGSSRLISRLFGIALGIAVALAASYLASHC